MYGSRKEGEIIMTTMQALDLAISALQEKNTDGELNLAIRLLHRLQKRELAANWSQSKIIDALDNWAREHGHPPTVTNLIEPGMPGASTIQSHFGMRASAFLRKKYPGEVKNRASKNPYGFTSESDWLQCFREQFTKHCIEEDFSSKTYNQKKDPGTPLWSTIARHCGTSQWSKLMELAGVQYPGKIPHHTGSYNVTYSSPAFEKFESALEEYRRLNDDLSDLMKSNREREELFLKELKKIG